MRREFLSRREMIEKQRKFSDALIPSFQAIKFRRFTPWFMAWQRNTRFPFAFGKISGFRREAERSLASLNSRHSKYR
jgi:hypothetical protein